MALPISILMRGLRSAQPAATAVSNGVLYYVTDEGVLEQSTSLVWVAYSFSNLTPMQIARLGIGGVVDANALLKIYGQYYSPLKDDGNSGTSKTLNWNDGNEHYVVMTGNVTFTFSNPVDGGRYVVLLNTGAGGFTVAWPATVMWSGAAAPVPTVGAGKVDLYAFMYVATLSKYVGVATLNFS